MRPDTPQKVSFTVSMMLSAGMIAWGIAYDNPNMFVTAAFATFYSIGALLGAILSVLVDIRDQKKKKDN